MKSRKLLHIAGRANWIGADGSVTFIDGRSGDLITSFGSNFHGYRNITIGCKKFSVHRLVAMSFLDGYSDDLQVDHIDGDKADNRVENLRMVDDYQNHRGFRTKSSGCSSKYRGVYRDIARSRWVAKIGINGKSKNLGSFNCEHKAALAYNAAAIEAGFATEALN